MTNTVGTSGKATAVGACIESVWGQTPLTVVAGAANTIGIPATNPHRFARMEPSGGIAAEATVEVPTDELDGGYQATRGYITDKKYNGDFSLKVDPENLYLFLLALLGRDMQTNLVAAGSNGGIPVNKHVLKFGKNAPSLTFEEIFANGMGRVTPGSFVQVIELTETQNKPITAKISLYGKHQVPNFYPNAAGVNTAYTYGATQQVIPAQVGGDGTKTWAPTAVPTYVDVLTGPLVFGSMGLGNQGGQFANSFVTLAGVAYPMSILEVTTTMTREIAMHQVGGSGLDPGDCVGNVFTVTGKINALFKDYNSVLAHLGSQDIGMNWQFVGPAIGGSGVNYSKETFVSRAKLTKAPLPLSAKELMINSEFSAYLDPTVGSLIVQTLINTFDNTSLAGLASSNPGGLGGWVAA
jgi:Phage tail tube protein